MPNFRLTLEYDGAGFSGWQVQAGGERTVQGTLEAAIARVVGTAHRVAGAGRTDAGVHAEGQVASVSFDTTLEGPRLARALNGCLPPDLAVIEACVAPDAFHARFSATGKVYRYSVWNRPLRSPLRRHRALEWRSPLDLAAMREASRGLEGRHDFASFQAAGSGVEETVRELRSLTIVGEGSGALDFHFVGAGFLRHMVRNLVGTLLEVGGGRRPPDSMSELLAARDRRLAGPTAAAHGLTLVRVIY